MLSADIVEVEGSRGIEREREGGGGERERGGRERQRERIINRGND